MDWKLGFVLLTSCSQDVGSGAIFKGKEAHPLNKSVTLLQMWLMLDKKFCIVINAYICISADGNDGTQLHRQPECNYHY